MIRTFLKGNVALMAANFVVGVAIARTIGPSGRGTVALTLLWPNMVLWLIHCNVPAAASYFMPKMTPEERRRFVASAFLFSSVVGSMAGIGLYFLAPLLFTGESAGYLTAIRIFLLLAPISALLEMATNILLALQDNRFWSAVRVIQPCVVAVGLLPLVVFRSVSVPTVILLNGCAGVLLTAASVGRVYQLVGFSIACDLRLFREAAVYGLKCSFGSLAGSMNLRLDQLIIGTFIGPGPLGIYAVAVNFTGLLSPIASATSVGIVAHLSSVKEAKRAESAVLALQKATLLLLFGGLGLCLLSPMIPLLYGPAFTASVWMTLILIPGTALYGIAGVAVRIIMAYNKPFLASLVDLVGLCVTVPALLLLLPAYGALGAAIASTASYGAVWLAAIVILSRVVSLAAPSLALPLNPRNFAPMLTRGKPRL